MCCGCTVAWHCSTVICSGKHATAVLINAVKQVDLFDASVSTVLHAHHTTLGSSVESLDQGSGSGFHGFHWAVL